MLMNRIALPIRDLCVANRDDSNERKAHAAGTDVRRQPQYFDATDFGYPTAGTASHTEWLTGPKSPAVRRTADVPVPRHRANPGPTIPLWRLRKISVDRPNGFDTTRPAADFHICVDERGLQGERRELSFRWPIQGTIVRVLTE